MEFKFRFELGGQVWGIERISKTESHPCPICDGTKYVDYRGEKLYCSKCNYEGQIVERTYKSWEITKNYKSMGMIVGKADVELEQHKEPKETYMCYETGVGSGRIWKVEDLFESQELALEECLKRKE